MVAGLLLVGCGDKDNPGADAGAGSDSTSTSASSGSTSLVADSGSTAGDQGASEETTASPPTEVAMSGNLLDFFLMAPIADARLSVLDLPGYAAQTDDEGYWDLVGLPVQSTHRFIIDDSELYWGSVIPFTTELEDLEEFELSQVSLEVIDIQIGVLQQQEPTVMVEEGTAVFLVALEQNTATGAIVELSPPPEPNTYYAPDAAGQPMLNTTEIQWSLYPVAVFFNLQPGPEGTYEITVTHPERECTVEDPQPPTFGRHINLIRVDCPPPE